MHAAQNSNSSNSSSLQALSDILADAGLAGFNCSSLLYHDLILLPVYQQQLKKRIRAREESCRAGPTYLLHCILQPRVYYGERRCVFFALQRDACRSPARERPVRRHCSVRSREQRLARLATLDCSVVVGISSSALSRARAVIPPG